MGFGSLFSGMLFLGADIDSLKKIEALKMRSLRGEDVSSEVIKTSFRSMVNSNVNLQDAKRNLSPANMIRFLVIGKLITLIPVYLH